MNVIELAEWHALALALLARNPERFIELLDALRAIVRGEAEMDEFLPYAINRWKRGRFRA